MWQCGRPPRAEAWEGLAGEGAARAASGAFPGPEALGPTTPFGGSGWCRDGLCPGRWRLRLPTAPGRRPGHGRVAGRTQAGGPRTVQGGSRLSGVGQPLVRCPERLALQGHASTHHPRGPGQPARRLLPAQWARGSRQHWADTKGTRGGPAPGHSTTPPRPPLAPAAHPATAAPATARNPWLLPYVVTTRPSLVSPLPWQTATGLEPLRRRAPGPPGSAARAGSRPPSSPRTPAGLLPEPPAGPGGGRPSRTAAGPRLLDTAATSGHTVPMRNGASANTPRPGLPGPDPSPSPGQLSPVQPDPRVRNQLGEAQCLRVTQQQGPRLARCPGTRPRPRGSAFLRGARPPEGQALTPEDARKRHSGDGRAPSGLLRAGGRTEPRS